MAFFNVEEANKEMDYKNSQSRFTSAKAVADYKHLQASQVERDAAIALINKN